MRRKKLNLLWHFVVISQLMILVLVNNVSPSPVSAAFQSSGPTRGREVVVGAFRIHVQIQQQRVVVMDIKGDRAAAVPATQLVSQFIAWDSGSKTASIAIAIQNEGEATLFLPVQAIITKVSPPTISATNADRGTGPGSWQWDYDAALLGGNGHLSPSELSGPRRWDFASPTSRDFQLEVQIRASVPLAPGEGGTIMGAGGTSITVQPNSIPYEVLIDIAPIGPEAFDAPLGDNLKLVGAVEVTFEPAVFGSLLPPSAPLQISIPAPADTPGDVEFIVAQQMLVDFAGDPPGMREQFVPVDTSRLVADKNLVTQADVFPGIFGGGQYGFLLAAEPAVRGFANGLVSDPMGLRPGAVVSNNTNTLVSIADETGRYRLFINGGPFTVTAFDPFRGSSGSASGAINVIRTTARADISLMPLDTPPVTRTGIRDGNFELGVLLFNFTNWKKNGGLSAVRPLDRLPFTSTTATSETIRPTEGNWMADINTGPDAVGGVGSSLSQRFIVPAGVQKLYFDYNFVSEEFPEFRGTIFNDTFRVTITTPDGEITFQVSVNELDNINPLIGDCGFPGGDNTCGASGWRTVSLDVPQAFAGLGATIPITVTFSVNDVGDNIFDTHVLLDNIRFSTLWIDAKLLQSPTAPAAPSRTQGRVESDVRTANEILSQAGVNVRIRNVQVVDVSDNLVDTDVNYVFGPACSDGRQNLKLNAVGRQIVGLNRSTTATDVNAYFVRSLIIGTMQVAGGYAIGPDDFCVDVEILRNSAVLLANIGRGYALAHELGHLLISPASAGSPLEHCSDPTNFMAGDCNGERFSIAGQLNRPQSFFINRSPLLVTSNGIDSQVFSGASSDHIVDGGGDSDRFDGAPDSGAPMMTTSFHLCNLDSDGDGDCDLVDFRLFQNTLGTCLHDADYHPTADIDGDECVTLNDRQELFPANTTAPQNPIYLPIILVNTP